MTYRKVLLEPLPGNLFGHDLAVRKRDGKYVFVTFGGYVSLLDISNRSWRRLRIKCDAIDSLPDFNMRKIESGHVLGILLRGKAYLVLCGSPELLVSI